jgi:hypothetical protein
MCGVYAALVTFIGITGLISVTVAPDAANATVAGLILLPVLIAFDVVDRMFG